MSDYMGSDKRGSTEGLFVAIYRQTYTRTLTYALRRTSNPNDAHDVVAETYMVGWRHVDELCQTRDPQAWLYAVAYRVLSNQRRGDRRRAGLVDRLESFEKTNYKPFDPVWIAEKGDEVERVAAAMATLSERDQEILRLAAFEELDHSEIAVVLRIKKPLVRSLLYRARKRLDRALAVQTPRQERSSGHIKEEGTESSPLGSRDE